MCAVSLYRYLFVAIDDVYLVVDDFRQLSEHLTLFGTNSTPRVIFLSQIDVDVFQAGIERADIFEHRAPEKARVVGAGRLY